MVLYDGYGVGCLMAKPILEHIKEVHGGNKSAMARALGVTHQSIQQWIRNGAMVTQEGYIIGKKTYQDTTGKES